MPPQETSDPLTALCIPNDSRSLVDHRERRSREKIGGKKCQHGGKMKNNNNNKKELKKKLIKENK